MKNIITILLTLTIGTCFGQGDLNYLKKNSYLNEYYINPFDCDSLQEDGVTSIQDRICANLKLQETDSILKIYYDSVRAEIVVNNNDSLSQSFELLQKSWRQFRDIHCEALYGGYSTSAGAVIYMDEMKKLTKIRIEEMKGLLKIYRNE